MVGRILRSADFQRVLAVPPRSRSAHFAAHHVAASPSLPVKPQRKAVPADLSTGDAPSCPPPVDEPLAVLPTKLPDAAMVGQWLGLVVPKKHARRSVTRNLIKREMRAVMASVGPVLPAGLWVLRLKAPFDRQVFTSPASVPLLQAARDELQQLLQRAVVPRR
jgi:ribonuclease P protein component